MKYVKYFLWQLGLIFRQNSPPPPRILSYHFYISLLLMLPCQTPIKQVLPDWFFRLFRAVEGGTHCLLACGCLQTIWDGLLLLWQPASFTGILSAAEQLQLQQWVLFLERPTRTAVWFGSSDKNTDLEWLRRGRGLFHLTGHRPWLWKVKAGELTSNHRTQLTA